LISQGILVNSEVMFFHSFITTYKKDFHPKKKPSPWGWFFC
jgi:hypothetical protein